MSLVITTLIPKFFYTKFCKSKTHGNFCKTVKSSRHQYHLKITNTKFNFVTASVTGVKCSVRKICFGEVLAYPGCPSESPDETSA